MFKLTRQERRGDRSRARIATPTEQVTPTFENGQITVIATKLATAQTLIKRHGFTMVRTDPPVTRVSPVPVEPPAIETPKPSKPVAPVKTRADELADATMAELRGLAKENRIKGRSTMDRDELIAAIIDAEA
jgi:hypothetical protein